MTASARPCGAGRRPSSTTSTCAATRPSSTPAAAQAPSLSTSSNAFRSGRIYAVDSSPDMISKITQAIEERGDQRVIPILASLTDFELPEQVDVVFSNAVLHWIPDDEALFGCLFRADEARRPFPRAVRRRPTTSRGSWLPRRPSSSASRSADISGWRSSGSTEPPKRRKQRWSAPAGAMCAPRSSIRPSASTTKTMPPFTCAR